jgi:hypothetical protein
MTINVTKPYKPRRLKTDPISVMTRRLYKLKSKNPAFKRKRELYQKKYKLKNKQGLKKRQDFVRKIRERLPLFNKK